MKVAKIVFLISGLLVGTSAFAADPAFQCRYSTVVRPSYKELITGKINNHGDPSSLVSRRIIGNRLVTQCENLNEITTGYLADWAHSYNLVLYNANDPFHPDPVGTDFYLAVPDALPQASGALFTGYWHMEYRHGASGNNSFAIACTTF